MTDREFVELLEAAAKAAKMELSDSDLLGEFWVRRDRNGYPREVIWNPLENDGDAMRLAMKLGISFSFRRNHNGFFVVAEAPGPYLFEAEDITGADDEKMRAAGRLVLVRAAAAMAKEAA
jgi:hypothetical protein